MVKRTLGKIVIMGALMMCMLVCANVIGVEYNLLDMGKVEAASKRPIKSIKQSKSKMQSGKSKISVKVTFKEKIKSATVVIQNSDKTTVKSFKVRNCKAKTFVWNGKSNTGSYVAAGKYRVKVQCGSQTKYSKYFAVTPSKSFAGGSGTSKSPYMISNVKQLKAMVKYNGCWFSQSKDINMGYEAVELFGSQSEFVGKYDGKGYKISNYLYSSTERVKGISLFGVIGKRGVVKNLHMDNVAISSGNSAAAIATKNYGKIQKCSVYGSISTVNASRDYGHYAGMICSENYGKVLACKSNGTITAKYSDTLDVRNVASHAAGIVAYNEGTVGDCVSDTNVEVTSGDTDCYAGCVVARNKGVVLDSEAKGTVNAHARTSLFGFGTGYAGGIVGFNEATINGCYFLGDSAQITGDACGEIYGGSI